ncbi:hypothetical protein NADFUDRAFT_47622 [Nadsonia fulvescens var. elongata DSM 6958]|uniref:Glycosyltransferase family 71 protein n=1 Tax=Nadsonia fulvescens var. elongata DSM 6958 TaxID=857566 RepID=A0A1E3PHV5_9ASCO|nr:hypothetical protein NADFUDRAFT_47622 [Nadsonia fulvescens var. elongata DSM 6958]
MKNVTHISKHYQYLIDRYGIGNFTQIPKLERCYLYFKELYEQDESWQMSSLDHINYDGGIYNPKQWMKERVERWNRDNKRNKNDTLLSPVFKSLQQEYNYISEQTRLYDSEILASVTHMRVFNSCFLENTLDTEEYMNNLWKPMTKAENNEGQNITNIFRDIETRLFPWFTNELPEFTRWNGTRTTAFPDIDGILRTEADTVDPNTDELVTRSKNNIKLEKRNDSKCLMKKLRDSFIGRGIVISASDKHLNDLLSLLRLLRSLGNTLPIEIMHNGDISEKSQEALVEVARTDDFKVPDGHLLDIVKDHVSMEFPKQELWFASTTPCISKEYQGVFGTWANKLVASLFSSFDEMLLIDADTVLLTNPNVLFEHSAYNKTKSLFFKDRALDKKLPQFGANFFKMLMPSIIDETLYGIPEVSQEILQREFFTKDFNHYMESGVVLMEKSSHFLGALMSMQLNIWSPSRNMVHGDKELFWLGQSAAGLQSHEFNGFWSGSAGMLNEDQNSISSTHPSHISSDDGHTLLWVNSGFIDCKFDPEDKVVSSRINAFIIPPMPEFYLEDTHTGPTEGWVMNFNICKGYSFSTYYTIGNASDTNHIGYKVTYNETETAIFDYYGKIWLGRNLTSMS